MSDSIDPDETAYYKPSHLDLCCLQKHISIAYCSERVKPGFTSAQPSSLMTHFFPSLARPRLHDHPQYTVLITEHTSKAYLISVIIEPL